MSSTLVTVAIITVVAINLFSLFAFNIGMQQNHILMIQILTSLSLIDGVLPPNLNAFYANIINITNLNIIPTQKIIDSISPPQNVDTPT